MSESKKGIPLSEEHRCNISASLKGSPKPKGEANPLYGIPRSKEVRRKVSQTKKGVKHSEEHRRKNAESHRKPEYNKAKLFFLSLHSGLSIKEKRKQLYHRFPNTKKQTIRHWVRQWQSADAQNS